MVKLIKLKRTQSVCTEKEREKERKNKEKTFFFIFLWKKELPPKKIKKIKQKNTLGPGPRSVVP